MNTRDYKWGSTMKRHSSKKFLGVFVSVVILASMALTAAPAAAQEVVDSQELHVEPETQDALVDTQATLTATVKEAPTTGPINIDFEIESGPNDADGRGYNTPELTCTIALGAADDPNTTDRDESRSCQVSYTSNRTGTDTIRAWIDVDNNNSTNVDPFPPFSELDPNEGRRASTSEPGTFSPVEPGTGDRCGNEPEKFDCTDVVSVSWVNPDAVATVLDCDDSGRPDTERDVNPQGTSETYTCTVYDQYGTDRGNTLSGQEVFGENETPVNDPDLNEGASYESPDYACITSFDPTTRRNFCTIEVRAGENEIGTAEICFWSEDTGGTGQPTQGAALCADEPTGEDQRPTGEDVPAEMSDLADQVEKTWRDPDYLILDCSPETDSNPRGTSHTVSCTARNLGDGSTTDPSLPQGGINIDVEATGANDPDDSNSPTTPDFTCTTAGDQDPTTPIVQGEGTCTFTHGGPEGTGTTDELGTTLYRAWVDADGNDATFEGDAAEGRDEVAEPGTENEPDNTDVVQKNWIADPETLTMTPTSDAAPVGTCNPYTITVQDAQGQPVEGAVIDVEQRHARADNGTNNDEPTVTFCEPDSGPNPSDVDESRGDLRNPDEGQQDNTGTAGGETVKTTDQNGQITIGIAVEEGQGSDGTGTVTITAFYDEDDDDDPDSNEAQDTSTKTWTERVEGRTIECGDPQTTGRTGGEVTITCVVRDAAGQPVSGEGVTFTSSGVGTVNPTQDVSDENGQVSTTASSNEDGQQTVTATLDDDTQGGEPDDVDECDRQANDPQGAPEGQCADSVTITWQEQGPECSDGIDNDNDGNTDHPDDTGCSSANDETETGETLTSGPCEGFAESSSTPRSGGGRVIVGTEGPDDLRGSGGNDLICALGGRDAVRGGGGDDTIYGGSGHDDLRGNAGDDTLFGQAGLDVMRGGHGSDTVRGGAQDDTMRGFTGNDRMVGGGGNDTLRAGDGRDVLRGNAGDDLLDGGGGRDRCRGGSGRDRSFRCER